MSKRNCHVLQQILIIESLREDFVRLMQKEADTSNQLAVLKAEMDSRKQESESKTAEIKQVQADLEKAKDREQRESANFETAKTKVQELLKD